MQLYAEGRTSSGFKQVRSQHITSLQHAEQVAVTLAVLSTPLEPSRASGVELELEWGVVARVHTTSSAVRVVHATSFAARVCVVRPAPMPAPRLRSRTQCSAAVARGNRSQRESERSAFRTGSGDAWGCRRCGLRL